MAVSTTNKRMSTTSFAVSEPIQEDMTKEEESHKSSGNISSAVDTDGLKKSSTGIARNLSGDRTSGDDSIEAIKARARKARPLIQQQGAVLTLPSREHHDWTLHSSNAAEADLLLINTLDRIDLSDGFQCANERNHPGCDTLTSAAGDVSLYHNNHNVEDKAAHSRQQNPQSLDNRRAANPHSYISQIRLEKEAALQSSGKSDWVDPLAVPSARNLSTREMLPHHHGTGGYEMSANNPTFPRRTPSTEGNLQSPTNPTMVSAFDAPRDNVLNAAVQPRLLWEREQDAKGAVAVVLNRKLIFFGGCMLVFVIVAIGIALGVALGGKGGIASSQQTGTMSPIENSEIFSSECVAAENLDGQSARFLQFSETLGLSDPNSAGRKAICWLADSDDSQIDPTNHSVTHQRFSLAVFFFSTSPENSGDSVLVDWLGPSTECSWLGVLCENETVVKLELTEVGLRGTLPPEMNFLSSLSELYLDGNEMSGTIPEELYVLTSLSVLNLERNSFEGSLSPRVGSLKSLKVLAVGQNELMIGSLPDSLFSLTGLEYVYMLGNNFDGSLSTLIGALTNLLVFAADSNSFTGILPTEVGLCTLLKELGLTDTDITSTIPSEIGLLGKLSALSLGYNLFGTIPSELGNCSSMAQMVLNTNVRLEGTIPSELGHLSKLEKLQLQTTQLTGSMPSEICSLRSRELVVLESDCVSDLQVDCPEPDCCSACF